MPNLQVKVSDRKELYKKLMKERHLAKKARKNDRVTQSTHSTPR